MSLGESMWWFNYNTLYIKFSYVIWFGDLNFRIDDFSHEAVNEKATSLYTNPAHRKMAIKQLLEKDQVSWLMMSHEF